MGRPRKHDSGRILDATRDLVLADGARAASIAAIADASGAPVGTLYQRFGSRENLLAEVWFRALGRFQTGYLDAARTTDPVEAGVAMAVSVVRFARTHAADARLLLGLRREDVFALDPDSTLHERLEALNQPLRAAVRDLTHALHGSAAARELSRVTLVVVDLPYSAVRRHAREGAIPAWVEREVAGAARTLLSTS